MQAIIREVFADATVLAIVHQLDHIHDYDFVAVMDRGSIVEYDTPARLLEQESRFRILYHS